MTSTDSNTSTDTTLAQVRANLRQYFEADIASAGNALVMSAVRGMRQEAARPLARAIVGELISYGVSGNWDKLASLVSLAEIKTPQGARMARALEVARARAPKKGEAWATLAFEKISSMALAVEEELVECFRPATPKTQKSGTSCAAELKTLKAEYARLFAYAKSPEGFMTP